MAFLPLAASADEPAFEIKHEAGQFVVSEAGKPVLVHQLAPRDQNGKYARANYIHPLYGLDGEVLTQDFPADHLHQRGVFWAWHQILVGGMPVGDAWETKDFLAVVREAKVVANGPNVAELQVIADWTSPALRDEAGQPKPFVRETVTIRVFRALKDTRRVDLMLALQALVPDVRIGGADNERGYSGFTVRVDPKLATTITDEQGIAEKDRILTPSRWAHASGQLARDRTGGIAILGHPSLPEFPSRWVLRRYGMQNAAYPGRTPVPLPMEKPLVLRYRLLVHRGPLDAAEIAKQQAAYEQTPLAENHP